MAYKLIFTRYEWVRAFDTNNEWIEPRKKHFLWHELFITHIMRIFTEIGFLNVVHITKSKSQIVEPKTNLIAYGKSRSTSKSSSSLTENALTKVKSKLSKLQKTDLSNVGSYYCSPSFFQTWSRNWRLTHWDLLHQYFPTLSAHSLKLKTFSTIKRLFVFCLMCSCFFDAAQTLLRSNLFIYFYPF